VTVIDGTNSSAAARHLAPAPTQPPSQMMEPSSRTRSKATPTKKATGRSNGRGFTRALLYGKAQVLDLLTHGCRALFQLTSEIGQDVREQAVAVAFDGTSSTTLLVDRLSGAQLAPAKLYNESQGAAAVKAAEASDLPCHPTALEGTGVMASTSH
jgi:hypothetical protein